MSTMVLRRAQIDEKTKKQIHQRVKTLIQQKNKDVDQTEQSDSADEQSADEQDTGEGTVYLFDASDHSPRNMVAWEGTKQELETYKKTLKEHKLDPKTKITILSPEEAAKRDEEKGGKRGPVKEEEKGKKSPKEEEKGKSPLKSPDERDDKDKKPNDKSKEEPQKSETDQGDKGKEDDKEKRQPGELLEHSHPARIPEGSHRQVAIKDRLIDEFGTEAKDWKVHKLDKSQLTVGVKVKFPDGTEKKYGQLSQDEKARVDKAISEGLAATKGFEDYTSVSPASFQSNMKVNLDRYDDQSVEESKNENEEPISKENIGEFSSGLRENGRTLLKKYSKAMSSISRPMAEQFVDEISNTVSEGVRDGSLGNVKQSDVDEFVRESVKRMLHQEVETRRRSLGDHGIRHVSGNCQSTMKMLGELQNSGMKITGKQKLMGLATMADHDIGYTVGDVGTDISKGKKHKEYSKQLADQDKDRYDKVFGREDGDKIRAMIATHDDPVFDWDNDPVASSVRLADNTSLFGKDKVQDLFLRSPRATELACKLRLAAEAKPDDKKLQENIKAQMHEVVDSGEFDDPDVEAMHSQIDEMSEGKFSTTTDILSRFSGELNGFKYDADKKMMNVNMRYSSEGQMVDQLFGDEVACKQFEKFSKDLGGQPVRGKRGNTIFKSQDGKPAFQLNIDGFNDKDDPQTAAMRDFAKRTARTELRRASMMMYPPPQAGEKDIEKAKKSMEPAKEKFTEEEWKKLMEAFDEGKGDPAALAKQLGMWALLQSEFAFLAGKTASDRIIRRLVIAALADKIANDFLADTTLQESVCVDREYNAGRGRQTQRKDKDLMSDTGGISKNRQRDPLQKPPRSDSHNRYRTKDKTPDQRDPDVDKKAFVAEATGIRRVTYYIAYPVETCDRCSAAIKQVARVEWKDGTVRKYGSECINKILGGDTSLKSLFKKNSLLLRKYQKWLDVASRPVGQIPKGHEYYGSGIYVICDDDGEEIYVERSCIMFHPDVDLDRNAGSNYAFVDADTAARHSGKKTYEQFRDGCFKSIEKGKEYLQREVERLESFLARIIEKGLVKAEQAGISIKASETHPLKLTAASNIRRGETVYVNDKKMVVLDVTHGKTGQDVFVKDEEGKTHWMRRSDCKRQPVKTASFESIAKSELSRTPRTLREAIQRS